MMMEITHIGGRWMVGFGRGIEMDGKRKEEEKGVMNGRSEKEGLRKKWRNWKTRVNDWLKDGELRRSGGGETGKKGASKERSKVGW